MKPNLEEDFKNQQLMLLALLDARRSLDGQSEAAIEIDRQVREVESYVRSYQMIRWYEQQKRKTHQGAPSAHEEQRP